MAGIGKDAVLGFQPGDWVELYDDTCVLNSRPGTLVRLLNAREDRLTLDLATATGSTDIDDFPLNPQVRRWDSPGPGARSRATTGSSWRTASRWPSLPRAATGATTTGWCRPAASWRDVDWPRDSAGDPVALLPAGVRHGTRAGSAIVTQHRRPASP